MVTATLGAEGAMRTHPVLHVELQVVAAVHKGGKLLGHLLLGRLSLELVGVGLGFVLVVVVLAQLHLVVLFNGALHGAQLLDLLVQQVQAALQLAKRGGKRLGHAPLVVAQDGHRTVGVVVHDVLLPRRQHRVTVRKLALQRHRRVVGTEHLGAQAWHER